MPQERPQLVGQAGDQVVLEVVEDVAIVAGERARLRVAQRAEMNTGRPALAALDEDGDVLLRQRRAEHRLGDAGTFLLIQSQLVGAELEQLAVAAQPPERQVRG